jgi:hypothetical protein
LDSKADDARHKLAARQVFDKAELRKARRPSRRKNARIEARDISITLKARFYIEPRLNEKVMLLQNHTFKNFGRLRLILSFEPVLSKEVDLVCKIYQGRVEPA